MYLRIWRRFVRSEELVSLPVMGRTLVGTIDLSVTR
jgi:hypothetical protein